MASEYLQQHRQIWGEVLQEWLAESGLTQKILADKIDRGERTIRSWLSGSSIPDKETIGDLIRILYDAQSQEAGGRVWQDIKPADVFDWTALLGWSVEETIDQVPNQAIRSWLASGLSETVPWPRQSLPEPHIVRDNLADPVISSFMAAKAYQMPANRAIVLYGAEGSGKRTLVAYLSRCDRLREYFRDGLVWIRSNAVDHSIPQDWERLAGQQIRLANPEQAWWDWVSVDETVGLVVLAYPTTECISTVLSRAGQQIRLLIIAQDRDATQGALMGHLKPDQIFWQPVTGLAGDQAIALIEGMSSSTYPEAEKQYIGFVSRQINRPASLRFLVEAAEQSSWRQVWEGIADQQNESIPQLRAWQQILGNAWQRLDDEEQEWLVHLSQGILRGSHFGKLHAATIWNVPVQQSDGLLEVFWRRGWLEKIDNEDFVPTQLAGILGDDRFRLPHDIWQFLRNQPSSRPWQWDLRRVWWAGRIFRQIRSTAQWAWYLSLAAFGIYLWSIAKLVFNTSTMKDEPEERLIGAWITKLQEQWATTGRIPPEEIWILYAWQQAQYILWTIGLIVMGILCTYLILSGFKSTVILLITLLLIIGIGWAVIKAVGWQLLFLCLYNTDETVYEVKLMKQVMKRFGH